jgi:hypothetical protein
VGLTRIGECPVILTQPAYVVRSVASLVSRPGHIVKSKDRYGHTAWEGDPLVRKLPTQVVGLPSVGAKRMDLERYFNEDNAETCIYLL